MTTQDQNAVARPTPVSSHDPGQQVCFVVMPFGRNPAEQRWFRGWFEAVIKPGVLEAGYHPILAAAEEQPGAINDEIRAHLALDPMVVVDLGGMEADDDPNPNVMYELGIRHAFGLPLVIMAWAGQRLPFDVSNQRAIMERRDMLSIEPTRRKLVAFVKSASEGKYYRPMEAVGRLATFEAASNSPSDDSVLTALVQEVRNLKVVVGSARFPSRPGESHRKIRHYVKDALRSAQIRKELFNDFLVSGGSGTKWARILRSEISEDFMETTHTWGFDEWRDYVLRRAQELKPLESFTPSASVVTPPAQPISSARVEPTEEVINAVREALPAQPWPKGTSHLVRGKLGLSTTTYVRAVKELIRRGIFQQQVDGHLLNGEAENHEESK